MVIYKPKRGDLVLYFAEDVRKKIDKAVAEATARERQRIRKRATELIDEYENDGEYREPEIRQFVADLLDGDDDA